MKYALMTSLVVAGTLAAAAINGELTATATAAQSCESLASLTLPNTTITLAQAVDAGAFTPPTPAGGAAAPPAAPQAFRDLPAFCRVAATLKPSSDSDIKIEAWMPASGWNGKFQAVGNGGWAGAISYLTMAAALRRGYATSSTDTGHAGSSGSFALGHPEKLIDYAYRSEHEMTVKSKAIVAAFFGNGPARSYWSGCSTGGRQALVEAQQFPSDFDGIIAGAAANPKTHLDAWRLWMSQVTLRNDEDRIPQSKYPMIHQAVVAACDAIDGLKDGLIDDPTRCHFDPKTIVCKDTDGPDCLTPRQADAVRAVMGPAKIARTGKEVFPGYEPGAELGWGLLIGGPEPYATALDQFRYIVFNNPHWDWRTFDLERDLAAAEKAGAGTLTAVSTDLSAFVRRGGKLIMYHGWSDQDVAPRASINYYTGVHSDAVRLFMVPGMGHCRGGEGPNTFDMVTPLEKWVEHGQAPVRVVASHSTDGKVDRTRPLCPYPQVAEYKGTASTDDAVNFVCKTSTKPATRD